MTWKKATTKPVAKPTMTELSEDLLSQIAGGAAKMSCHTRRTLGSLGAVSLGAYAVAAI